MDQQKATTTWRWGRRLCLPAALTLSLTLGLAACGGSSPKDAVATLGDDNSTEDVSNSDSSDSNTEMTEEERQQAMLDFARCMREHGIDMPDPTFDENGGSSMMIGAEAGGSLPDQATMEAAQEACEPIMEDVVAAAEQDMDPEEVAKRQEEALAFAKCMRDHGVDFPDPQFEGGGRMTQTMTADPNDPNFQAAQEACATEFSGGGPGFSVGGPASGSASDGQSTNSDGGDE